MLPADSRHAPSSISSAARATSLPRLLAYELHHDLAVPAVVQLDQEDPLPLADDEPAVRYRHGLTGAQQQVLAV